MKVILFRPLIAFVAAGLLASCGGIPSNSKPSAAEMDRYYKQAEVMAQNQIRLLDSQKASGRLSQEQYDLRRLAIESNIGKTASELAWAKHELVDSQKRSLGIPTGDTPQQLSVPTLGGMESFYQPYGQVGSTFGSATTTGSTPTSSPLSYPTGSMWQGYTPGTIANQAGAR